MDSRETYYQIKANLLECYFDYCTHKILSKNEWVDGEHEIGYAYEQFVDVESERHTAYRMQIEKVMLEVIAYILDGGRNKQAGEYHRMMISKLLSVRDLSKEINNLPDEERIDFVSDLKLLDIAIPSVTS